MQVCWYCLLVGRQFFISRRSETSLHFHRILDGNVTCDCIPLGAMRFWLYFSHLTNGKTKELEVDSSLEDTERGRDGRIWISLVCSSKEFVKSGLKPCRFHLCSVSIPHLPCPPFPVLGHPDHSILLVWLLGTSVKAQVRSQAPSAQRIKASQGLFKKKAVPCA